MLGTAVGIRDGRLKIRGALMLSQSCPTPFEGLYVTTEDNEDNGRMGKPDDDMSYTDPVYTCDGDDNEPIEFNIVVDQPICSAGVLGLMLGDSGIDTARILVNGHLVGNPVSTGELWTEG